MDMLKSDRNATADCSADKASADLICSNIEEGYGRLRAEYSVLDIARGSAQETRVDIKNETSVDRGHHQPSS
jgi:hypothetical protein